MNLYPLNNNPYYILTDPYTRVSAGIRCLHLLCHALNLRGIPAYVILIGEQKKITEEAFSPDLMTPILTQRIARHHFENGLTPITVYPEIISGNPYNAPCVVRYILNFPGLLGGQKEYGDDELCFSYSKVLAAGTRSPENVLFIPASDTRVFHPPEKPMPRSGSCYYASKYKREHKGALLEVTKDSIEITSRMPTSQSPQEIADLFHTCEFFYTYENTALAHEATLCGCPTVFLPNEHLEASIAIEELGDDGIAWGNSPEQIAHAKKTVHLAYENYLAALQTFQQSLTNFIALTQQHSKNKTYSTSQFLNLSSQLAPSPDASALSQEIGIKERSYATLLSKLPWRLERQIGAILCSLGLLNDGQFLWNRAKRRSHPNNQNIYDELENWKK